MFCDWADYYVRNSLGRYIDQAGVMEILTRADEANLVLQPNNCRDIVFICWCCGCCCGVLTALKLHPRPSERVASPFRAQANPEICEEGELVPESTVANFATVQGAIKSIVLESDSYAIELVRYIHRNPLEAGLVDNLQKYEWSPHKIYLSDSKKYKWLHKDYILKLFSKSKPESIRLYEQFALKETPEEINQIFGRGNLPAVLGSKSFFDRTKDKFFNLMSMCEGVNSRNFI
ncbi:MAG: hypothetical protein JW902_07820 [Syntrophaceae bacterium]|nr:hypothetical protein [Syntrophaceae bacterium]